MGEERIATTQTHGDRYSIVTRGSKENESINHGTLEKGVLGENLGDSTRIFRQAAPYLIVSWIALVFFDISYLQIVPELSAPLQAVSRYFPTLDPNVKNSRIFFASFATTGVLYLCLAMFIFYKFCRQKGFIAVLFASISFAGPCAALFGANAHEIQLILTPLVLNTALTTSVFQMRNRA